MTCWPQRNRWMILTVSRDSGRRGTREIRTGWSVGFGVALRCHRHARREQRRRRRKRAPQITADPGPDARTVAGGVLAELLEPAGRAPVPAADRDKLTWRCFYLPGAPDFCLLTWSRKILRNSMAGWAPVGSLPFGREAKKK